MGVGIFELAIAMSTTNPLLLIGALIELTAGIRGIFNDGDLIYMEKQLHSISLQFSLQNNSIESALRAISLESTLHNISLDNTLEQVSKYPFEN